ncbi:bifunctional 2-polyprenyl-6-hydroxyphenol methylase/3-demethylubiquinol 3-O-methyltransferase UbiG [Undibacterium sp. LX40W]|nr:class I SAM-dependent methyltransferase [Undibacterium sp. LX40W]
MVLRERSDIGTSTILNWSKTLPPGANILDLGCGSGKPIAIALARSGFKMTGIDTSETLVKAFRKNLPQAQAKCESVDNSTFFNREFDAVIAIGLMFLLNEAAQAQLIRKVANHLAPGGQFLFTAPTQIHQWQDVLTGAAARSLGADVYLSLCRDVGLKLQSQFIDEGDNHYYLFSRLS